MLKLMVRLAFTEQQKRIIKLLGQHLTAAEIATALGLTAAEVETELLAIANQFGVSRHKGRRICGMHPRSRFLE